MHRYHFAAELRGTEREESGAGVPTEDGSGAVAPTVRAAREAATSTTVAGFVGAIRPLWQSRGCQTRRAAETTIAQSDTSDEARATGRLLQVPL